MKLGTDDAAAEKVEEGESEMNGENKEDDMEERRNGNNLVSLFSETIHSTVFEDFSALFYSADSSTFAAGRGGVSVFNGSEENSTSSSTDDAHSSLNTEEEEEELAHGIVSGL